MELNEFKDRLFDLINDTNNLPIQDISVKDKENQIIIYLTDGTCFTVTCKKRGRWWLMR